MEDFPLPIFPDTPNWCENYALAGLDPAAGIGVFCHVGRWRKDLTLWREVVTVLLPDRTVVAHRGIGNACAAAQSPGGPNLGIKVIEDGRSQSWSFLGGARHRPVERYRSALLSDGPLERVEFSLEFCSDLPMWHLGKGGDSSFAGHHHIEQIGRLTGDIMVGDTVYRFDSEVNRDHSRGPRLTDGLIRHSWFHGVLANGVRFYAYDAEAPDAADGEPKVVFSEACVVIDGAMRPAALSIEYRLPLSHGIDHIQDRVPFRLHYDGGAIVGAATRFATTMFHQFTYPWDTYLGARQVGAKQSRRMMEQGVIYEIEGGVSGYGHMERTVPGVLLTDDDLDS